MGLESSRPGRPRGALAEPLPNRFSADRSENLSNPMGIPRRGIPQSADELSPTCSAETRCALARVCRAYTQSNDGRRSGSARLGPSRQAAHPIRRLRSGERVLPSPKDRCSFRVRRPVALTEFQRWSSRSTAHDLEPSRLPASAGGSRHSRQVECQASHERISKERRGGSVP